MSKNKIEIHESELGNTGVQLKKIDSNVKNSIDKVKKAHRDDHYIFYVQQQGQMEFMVDFKNYSLIGKMFFFICPGQVHYYQKQINSKGYFLFIDASLIAENYRDILENHENLKQVFSLSESQVIPLLEIIDFQISDQVEKNIKNKIVHSLIHGFVGIIINEIFKNEKDVFHTTNRKTSIVFQFRKLIRNNFVKHKMPKDYASLLSISVPYLNEVVKDQTGYAASYWIQQEILLEAKRLLYYTQLNSKEIAFSLGYEDYAYFSRFFKKNTNSTPLEFRNNQLDLSNKNL